MMHPNPLAQDPTPPPTEMPTDGPDVIDADSMLTVVNTRTVTLVGFAAGVLVPLIPLVILALAGSVATLVLSRGTIDFSAPSAPTGSGMQIALAILLLVVLCSGMLGAAMGIVRRWSVRRGIVWRLLVGHYFSSHPGPHSVIALVVVPLLVAAILHATSAVAGYSLSFAPLFFLIFPPAWMLSGLMFESAWEALVFPLLRSTTAEPMKWLAREAALFRLLKDDSYLFGCRLNEVRIDSDSGVAHIRGDFRTPDHLRRVREVGLRVIGVKEVEVTV